MTSKVKRNKAGKLPPKIQAMIDMLNCGMMKNFSFEIRARFLEELILLFLEYFMDPKKARTL